MLTLTLYQISADPLMLTLTLYQISADPCSVSANPLPSMSMLTTTVRCYPLPCQLQLY